MEIEDNNGNGSESDKSSTVPIWAAAFAEEEERDPTCLVTACTLAVAGRVRGVSCRQKMRFDHKETQGGRRDSPT